VRLRAYWAIGIILLGAAVYAGYRAVEWPGFALNDVAVSGATVTPRSEILRAAGLQAHGNIWLQNLGAARSRIEALPYVRTARLLRRPPGTILIQITERTPDGCLVGRDGAAARIDDEGRVLEAGCGSGRLRRYWSRLVIPEPGTFVRDASVLRLQADAQALAGDGHVYVGFAHDRFGDLQATLPSGVVVLFGAEGDIQQKARLVAPILRETSARGAAIAAIDLRAPRTPVVRYK